MICAETNIINYLTNSDYTEEQAKKVLTLYYDVFTDCVEHNRDAEDCGNEIIRRHMEDVDRGINIL